MKRGLYVMFGKRFFDIGVSFIFLVVFSPVLIIVAMVSRMRLSSPVLFSQIRPGLNAAPFQIFKFRTMTNARKRSSVR